MPASAVLFSGPLQTERLPSGRRRLLRELSVHVDGRLRIAPKGFETDFSTLTRLGHAFVDWSRVDVAGVIHDALYSRRVNRRQADREWRLIARSGKHRAMLWQAWLCWLVLRLVGWWPYYGLTKKLLRALRLR